jgi:hypothetical protein
MGAFPFEGSQRASTMMAENAVVTIMTLNRPIRSAIMPGRIRPNILVGKVSKTCRCKRTGFRFAYEAALRMDRRYEARLLDMPSFSA